LSPVHATGAHLEHDRPAVDGGPVPIPITFAAPFCFSDAVELISKELFRGSPQPQYI
jgi:hypothetical protein